MRNHGLKRSLMWIAVVMMITTMLCIGCENVLGEDGETNQEDEQGQDDNPDNEDDTGDVTDTDEIMAEDGTLTLSVSNVPMDLESTTEGDTDLLFAAFVLNSGGNPLDAADSAENWVAMVAEEIVDGGASATAFEIVDGVRGDEWMGTAGENYDIYYTVYRVTLSEDGPPQKDGVHFIEKNPECVCGTVDWQTPVTYLQDGDVSLSSSYEEYLETSFVEFVAQGALGLVGLVMNSLPSGGLPEESEQVVLEPEVPEITVEMTANNSTGSTTDAELVITIDEYEYPNTGLDPAPTASGTITLSVLVTGEEDLQVGFVTSDLLLSLGDDSVAVEMDGAASDFPAGGPPSTLTGAFACDGAEHDLAILREMYEVSFPELFPEPVPEPQ